MEERKVLLSTGIVSIVAVLTTTVLWMTSAGKKAKIKKIRWMNRAVAGNGYLRIGYLTLGAVFTPVLPDILMVNLIDDEMEPPACGNDRDGFIADTTPATGTLGYIVAQSTVAGAAPNDIQIELEVEEA